MRSWVREMSWPGTLAPPGGGLKEQKETENDGKSFVFIEAKRGVNISSFS